MVILTVLCKADAGFIHNLEKIDKIRGQARNTAAHEIHAVSDAWIKQRTNCSSNEIMELIRYFMKQAGIETEKGNWDSYEKMNSAIAEKYRDIMTADRM